MKVIKLWCHVMAFIKKLIYRMISGGKVRFGRKTTFRHNFHIMTENGGSVKIGDNCFFNNGCSINSLKKVTIGDGTIFGENVHIYDHNHKFRSEEDSIKSQGYSVEEVNIGNHVWIGTNVVILKGVTIGDNSVIGAGSVIENDIPKNSIVTCSKNIEIRAKD